MVGEQVKRADVHPAGPQREVLPLSRQVISAPAGYFGCRVNRRNLLNFSNEGVQGPMDSLFCWRFVYGNRLDGPLAVIRVAARAQAKASVIRLFHALDVFGEPSGRSHANY